MRLAFSPKPKPDKPGLQLYVRFDPTVNGNGGGGAGNGGADTATVDDTRPCTDGSGLQCLQLPIVYRDFHGLEMTDNTASPDFFYIDDVNPPSTQMTWPVTYDAARDAR